MSTLDVTADVTNRTRCSEDVVQCLLASPALCALCDAEGVVRAASAALLRKIPTLVERSITDAFAVNASTLYAAEPSRGVPGAYTDAHGELVPLTLQRLFDLEDAAGRAVVLVNDGAPYRDAEASRFSRAPFAVMRLSDDGTIRFLNPAAVSAFNLGDTEQLVGRFLPDLVDANDADTVRREIDRCLRGHSEGPIDVAVPGASEGTQLPLRLAMMPDLAPGVTLGVVVVVQTSPVQAVRDAIRKIALAPQLKSWRARLRRVLDQVKTVIPFDHANFGIYSRDLRLFRAVLLKPKSSIRWPARWMELPPDILDWLDRGRTWVDDMPKFLDLFPTLRDSEVARAYQEHRIVSSLTLPTRRAGGRPTSALTLCSVETAKYGEAELKMLRQLDLEPILLRIEAEIDAENEQFWEQLKRRLAADAPLSTLAESIVTDVAKHFDWDHVSLFRANRLLGRFELVFQHAEPGCALKDGFTQPFGEGMLGATLDRSDILIVNDVRALSQSDHGLYPVHESVRSAMTVPVRLHGRIRWILNAESSVTDTFRGPDREAIVKIVQAVEDGLEQRMIHEIKTALLHETQQGVVLTSSDGAILDINDVAARLLGRTAAAAASGDGKHIHDYAANDDTRDILLGQVATAGRRVELEGDDGETRVALATRRDLDQRLDTCVWFLTDVETVDWSRSLRFLRETVTDVAQQTRAPLAMASTLAQQLPALCATRLSQPGGGRIGSTVQTVCDRVVAEVGKADITFERLAERLSIFKDPVRCREDVDLTRCVGEVVTLLPKRDQDRIDPQLPKQPVIVEGDGGRLAFVVRSIVANLIRSRPADDESEVRVALDKVDGCALLKMELTATGSPVEAQPAESGDVLLAAYYAAREDAGLGLRAVKKVVRAHGGELRHLAAPGGDTSILPWTAFEIVLPLKHEEARPS